MKIDRALELIQTIEKTHRVPLTERIAALSGIQHEAGKAVDRLVGEFYQPHPAQQSPLADAIRADYGVDVDLAAAAKDAQEAIADEAQLQRELAVIDAVAAQDVPADEAQAIFDDIEDSALAVDLSPADPQERPKHIGDASFGDDEWPEPQDEEDAP
jgi:hypothetical protein